MSTTSTRPPAAVAPWAEVVPGYGPVTVDLLLTLPDDGYRYEVVEGVLVRMAGSGLDATTIGGLLVIALGSFVYARRLGLVTPSDGVYKFVGAETGLLPDVALWRRPRSRRSRIAGSRWCGPTGVRSMCGMRAAASGRPPCSRSMIRSTGKMWSPASRIPSPPCSPTHLPEYIPE